MRFLNIASVYVLANLSACSSGKDTAGDDTDVGTGDADTDSDSDTDVETAETGDDGPGGPWEVGYLGYAADIGVDASGNLTSVLASDGNTYPPGLYITLVSVDYFNGATDEACVIAFDISSATTAPNVGANYATWAFDGYASAPYYDGCYGLASFIGYDAGSIWGTMLYTVALGPFDTAAWGTYFPGYEADHVGAAVTDQLFIDPTTKEPYQWSLFGQGFPFTTGSAYDSSAPYPAAGIPTGVGVTAGYYSVDMGGYVTPIY